CQRPARAAPGPARPGAPAWRRPAALREGRPSFQLDQLEAVAAGGFLALRPLAREQARAALTTQTAEAERRKVMLARLQRSGRRWRGGRQAHQQLVDLAHDLLLAAGDLGCARIRPPVEAAGSALLEKHLDHRHGLLLAQEQREPPPALVAQQPAARFGHDAQIAQCRLAFALAVLRLPLGEED